ALPLQAARCVVDLGAGTGKFTRLLLQHLPATTRLVAVEPVAEMSAKLAAAGIAGHHRVILIDPNPVVGATFGAHGRPVINEALSALG
ncbi:class I SAM-dependent methyltransferase, partial [Acinetobacter baumannii]